MGLQTGDDGKVLAGTTELADITGWSFRTTSRSRSYSSSATGGYRRRVVGSREGNGEFRFKLDVTSPITDELAEGSLVTLRLHLDAARYYSVPAQIDALEMGVEVDGGDATGGSAEFSTDGPWTEPAW